MRITDRMFDGLEAASTEEYNYDHISGGIKLPFHTPRIRRVTLNALFVRGLVRWDDKIGPARLVLTSMGRTVYEKEKTK